MSEEKLPPPESALVALAPQPDVGGNPIGGLPPGAWRDGALLTVTRDVTLPHRCVICNAPGTVRLRRRVSWHEPGYYLLAPIALLIYLIARPSISKHALIEFSLCDAHARERRRGMRLGWAATALGFAAWMASAPLAASWLAIPGFVTFIAGIAVAGRRSNVLQPTRIKALCAWLSGAGPEFMRALPPFRDEP